MLSFCILLRDCRSSVPPQMLRPSKVFRDELTPKINRPSHCQSGRQAWCFHAPGARKRGAIRILERLVIISLLFAFVASAKADAWTLRSWQLKDGLPNIFVVGTARTPDGYLWVGTRMG